MKTPSIIKKPRRNLGFYKWTILDSKEYQNPRDSEHSSSSGFYSGGHSPKVGSDPRLNELVEIWESVDDSARADLLGVARGLSQICNGKGGR